MGPAADRLQVGARRRTQPVKARAWACGEHPLDGTPREPAILDSLEAIRELRGHHPSVPAEGVSGIRASAWRVSDCVTV